jgi:hypothetical protein
MIGAQSWRGREAMLVGAIFAALVAVAAVWLALDRRPPEWDHANHLERAVACAGDLARGDLRAILAADFAAFLRQLKGFKRASATLAQGVLSFSVSQPGPDVTAWARLVPASDRPFAIAFERVRAGGIPVPDLLVDWVVRSYDPSLALASRVPVRLEVGRVGITSDAISIEAGP